MKDIKIIFSIRGTTKTMMSLNYFLYITCDEFHSICVNHWCPRTSVTDGYDKLFKTTFPQKEHGASGIREGSVLRMGIAGLQDVDILARCKGQRPCQGTGFPGKG